jgi:hypothetical protein
MNRIQFQKGISLSRFQDLYGTEEQCEAVVEQNQWPDGFCCPACSGADHFRYRRGGPLVFQCRVCRKIGVSYPAAWRMKHKLMQVMVEREQETRLSGRVEVDDAYLGGENPGGKVGRGSENKIPFIAAVQTNEKNHPKYAVFSKVQAFSREEVTAWASRSLVSGTTVVSDGLDCFRAVSAAGRCDHQREVVGSGRKSTDMDCFTWVNTILGNLKTAIAGTYHAFDFDKYAHRYLGEYQYRFNRRFDLAGMLTRLIRATARSGKRPEAWLRLAED